MLENIEKNKIYPISKNLGFIAIDAMDSGKTIFNIIEYPVSPNNEKNWYTVIANSESKEDCLIKAIRYLDLYYQKMDKLYDLIEKSHNLLSRSEKGDHQIEFDQVEISRSFCIKEMKIPEDQIAQCGPWRWNLVFSDKKKCHMGSQ